MVEETEAPSVDVEDISEDTQDPDYEPYSPAPSTSSHRSYKASAPSKSRKRQVCRHHNITFNSLL